MNLSIQILRLKSSKTNHIIKCCLTASIFAILLCLYFFSNTSAEIEQDAFSCVEVSEIPRSECNALVKLYEETEGERWKENHGWLVFSNPCTWFGVRCSNGHVSELSLGRAYPYLESHDSYTDYYTGDFRSEFGEPYYFVGGLTGDIPSEIGDLTYLTYLRLSGNKIQTLPAEIGNLSRLRTLDLENNQLTSIPTTIGNLANLSRLDLGDNQITSLPNSIDNLSRLYDLGLENNQLTGIPTTIFNLNLSELNLNDNQITSLPNSIGNLNVSRLHLNGNQITSLPNSIGNLNVSHLHLNGNQITSLPNSIGNLANLSHLYLNGNQITSLPNSIGNLANLSRLYLNGNQITSLPNTIGNSRSLIVLTANNNLLQTLPTTVSNLSRLEVLMLSRNRFTSLPSTILELTSLLVLDLNYNRLSVNDSEQIDWLNRIDDDWASNQYVDVDGVTEPTPTICNRDWTTVLILLYKWIIPQAECEALVALYESTGGSSWLDNSGWLMDENPCTWYGVSCEYQSAIERTHVVGLDLSTLGLSGAIPPEIGNLSRLITLDLSDNQLNTTPRQIGDLAALRNLNLGGNPLGSLPTELWSLPSLRELRLWNTQLENIPDAIQNLWTLTLLDISSNQLQRLPSEIGDLYALYELDISGNQLTELPTEIGNIAYLRILSASHNRLARIPATIGNMYSLRDLNLSHNNLTTLPSTIGNLSQLIYLYLSYNYVTVLPSQIGDLSSLFYLQLFYNQLESLPSAIGNLPNLSNLYLSGNHITITDDELAAFIDDIDGEGTSFQSTAPETCLADIFVSSSSGGRVSGISFQDEDILTYNECTDRWAMYFDGSDVGLGSRDVDAFAILNNGHILISLDRSLSIFGLGRVDDSDIIKFIPTRVGGRTEGRFVWYLDGSDVGLTKSSEDIDAIAFLSGRRLLISTSGNAAVPGVRNVRDEDLLILTLTQTGQISKGQWSRYFDSSDIALTQGVEDVNGVSFDERSHRIDLTTHGNFAVSGVRGTQADIFNCLPVRTGGATICAFSSQLTWDGSRFGFASERVDGIMVTSTEVRAAGALSTAAELEYVDASVLPTVAIDAPVTEFIPADGTTTLTYTIANLSTEATTYNLELDQRANWLLSEIPTSITLDAQAEVEVTVDIKPTEFTEETITLHITDQGNPDNRSIDVSEISVIDFEQFVYLPFIVR